MIIQKKAATVNRGHNIREGRKPHLIIPKNRLSYQLFSQEILQGKPFAVACRAANLSMDDAIAFVRANPIIAVPQGLSEMCDEWALPKSLKNRVLSLVGEVVLLKFTYHGKRTRFRLNSEILRTNYGQHNYRNVVMTLRNMGVLKSDDDYSALKHYSKTYWLADEWDNRPLERIPIKNKWAKKMWSKRRRIIIRTDNDRKQLQDIQKINVQEGNVLWKTAPPDIKRAIQAILDNDIYFSSDRFGRRYHPLTNMPNPLFAALKVDEQPLLKIDIRNAHYLHLLKWFEIQMREADDELNDIFSGNYCSWMKHTLSIPINNITNNNPLMLVSFDGLTVELQEYKNLVESGFFYEWLVGEVKKIGYDMTRDEIKLPTQEAFFGTGRGKLIWKVFKQRFPLMAKVIKTYKKINGYERFAQDLLNIEAQFVQQHILTAIHDEYPDCWVVTIHDAIVVKQNEGWEPRISDLIREIYKKKGLNVSLKIEYAEDIIPQYEEKFVKMGIQSGTFWEKYKTYKQRAGPRNNNVRPKRTTQPYQPIGEI